MSQKNDPDYKESVKDKANTVGKKIVRTLKIVLVLLLIAGLVYVLKSCGVIGGHNDQDNNDNTEIEQIDDDYDDTDDYDEDGYDVDDEDDDEEGQIEADGEYTTAEDVALYIHTYHKLPSNYMTKDEAIEKGFYKKPKKYGIMIGGDHFGNYEELLPTGEEYFECDVDYKGNGRGKNRLIYTTDGTVYHTTDHYESFTQIY